MVMVGVSDAPMRLGWVTNMRAGPGVWPARHAASWARSRSRGTSDDFPHPVSPWMIVTWATQLMEWGRWATYRGKSRGELE